ncbi:MAG: hypothetical protein ROO76_03075 [Terriglobia bacterium]|nr:hypothetical protein [Terriglobia bacterium]
MKTRITIVVVAFLLMTLGLTGPAAQAQGPCNLKSLTGTYAIAEKGSSAILDPNSEPYPLHWAGALSPFVAIGEVTFDGNGIGKGFYWIRIGSFSSGPDPVPVEVTVTELNADCTGKLQFPFNLFGSTYTVEERFISFDNGRESRSIPTETGVPTLTYVGETHRIGKPGDPPNSCGQQTAQGSYLWTVENLVRFDTPYPIFSDALLIRMNVSMTGEFTGTLYEKLGPTGNIELPVWGTTTVNPDCSFVSILNIDFPNLGITATAPVRGVLYDEGKKAFGLNMNSGPIGTQYSFGEAVRIGQ